MPRIYGNHEPVSHLPTGENIIIQGRPTIDATGYFELTEPPGFAKDLAEQLGKGGRPTIPADKRAEAERLRGEGKSYRDIADELDVSVGTVSGWLSPKKPQ